MAEWASLSRFLLSGIKHNKKPWPKRDPSWSIRKEWIYIMSGDRTVSRSIRLCGSAGSFMSRVSLRFSEMSWFVEWLLYEGDLRLEMAVFTLLCKQPVFPSQKSVLVFGEEKQTLQSWHSWATWLVMIIFDLGLSFSFSWCWGWHLGPCICWLSTSPPDNTCCPNSSFLVGQSSCEPSEAVCL